MLFTSLHDLVVKTGRTLFERTKEHVPGANSAINGHLHNYSNVEHLLSIDNLILNVANMCDFRLNFVCHNTKIIDQSNNFNVLLFKETYHIKEKCSVLNNRVKGSREMQFF